MVNSNKESDPLKKMDSSQGGGEYQHSTSAGDLPQREIAIIGLGAAGNAVTQGLVESAEKGTLNPSITIFEPTSSHGEGVPYNEKSGEARLHGSADVHTFKPGEPLHFVNWMDKNWSRVFPNMEKPSFDEIRKATLPRRVLGKYLAQCFKATSEKAGQLGVPLQIVRQAAMDINNTNNKLVVKDARGEERKFDDVVLCLGHAAPGNVYNLQEGPNYINDPLSPSLEESLKEVPLKNKKILIIGTSLTAQDSGLHLLRRALAENERGESIKIMLSSRNARFSFVHDWKCPDKNNFELKYLTGEGLQQLIEKEKIKEGELEMGHIRELAKKEYARFEIDPKNVEKWEKNADPPHERLRDQFDILEKLHANGGDIGKLEKNEKSDLYKIDLIWRRTSRGGFEYPAWNLMSERAKQELQDNYSSIITSIRSDTTWIAAKEILEAIEAKKIEIIPGLENVQELRRSKRLAEKEGNSLRPEGYQMTLKRRKGYRSSMYADAVINALQAEKICEKNKNVSLLRAMEQNGLLSFNGSKGVEMDFDTYQINSSKSIGGSRIYGIGPLLEKGTRYKPAGLGTTIRGVQNLVHAIEQNRSDQKQFSCENQRLRSQARTEGR